MSWANGGDDWASGDARNFTPTNDEWNESSAGGAAQWNGGGASGFDSAPVDNDCGDVGAGNANGTGPTGCPSGACFNCGQEGHMKSECPEPRKFIGECRACGQTGHPAKECPSKPKKCNQCLEEGHDTMECKNKKVVDRSDVPDMSEADAWKLMKEASDERDIGDFKEALKVLSKANPEINYLDVENECRKRGLDIYLIGLKKDVSPAYTNTNLQDEVCKTYTLGFFTSASCPRPILMPSWPKDAEDNKARLADAGVPLERGVIICSTCGEPGHSRKVCDRETTYEAPKVACYLCNQLGHRVRDCVEARFKARAPRTCRICSSEEHMAADCPDKPKMICRRCEQEGHRSSECENEPVIRCINCEELGHLFRDCPLPKDWSKIKCRNCGESGHGAARCKAPPKEEGNAGNSGKFGSNDAGATDGAAANTGGDNWQTNVPEPITASGW